MGDLHFSNWVRLVVFVFLTSVTLDPIISTVSIIDW
jgi:hypothetical protein